MTELIEAVGLGLCQSALGPKQCPCLEKGVFNCRDAHPGTQAQAALTAITDAGYRIVKDEEFQNAGGSCGLSAVQREEPRQGHAVYDSYPPAPLYAAPGDEK